MGILSENLVWTRTILEQAGWSFPFAGKSMLELGNQFLYVWSKPWPEYPDRFVDPNNGQKLPVSKQLWQTMGLHHTSIDLNGQDGALPYDLSVKLPLLDKEHFEVLTDFGTSEHVPNLWQCLKNLHDHSRPGSIFFHVNPLTGNWPGHGLHYRMPEFYQRFASVARYEIMSLSTIPACGNTTDGWNVACAMRRSPGSIDFIAQDDFEKLGVLKK